MGASSQGGQMNPQGAQIRPQGQQQSSMGGQGKGPGLSMPQGRQMNQFQSQPYQPIGVNNPPFNPNPVQPTPGNMPAQGKAPGQLPQGMTPQMMDQMQQMYQGQPQPQVQQPPFGGGLNKVNAPYQPATNMMSEANFNESLQRQNERQAANPNTTFVYPGAFGPLTTYQDYVNRANHGRQVEEQNAYSAQERARRGIIGQGNDMPIAPPYNPNAGIEPSRAQPQGFGQQPAMGYPAQQPQVMPMNRMMQRQPMQGQPMAGGKGPMRKGPMR
jgi:hypothetical protein